MFCPKNLLKRLPDFDDEEAEQAALAHALAFPQALRALSFLMGWGKPDLAARLVIERHGQWSGAAWHILPDVAKALDPDHALAASVLYRALAEDILTKARSKAYGQAARYWKALERLSADADVDPARPLPYPLHVDWRGTLTATHKRKEAFWSLVAKAKG